MAQRVQVILVCDVHDEETPGSQTIGFGVDGTTYEIDVCDQHAAEMRQAFGRYVGLARRASSGRGSAGRAGGGSRRRRSRGSGEAAAIRDWARGQGLPVPERGRIPADLAAKYAAANR
jgi:hypothetical protein